MQSWGGNICGCPRAPEAVTESLRTGGSVRAPRAVCVLRVIHRSFPISQGLSSLTAGSISSVSKCGCTQLPRWFLLSYCRCPGEECGAWGVPLRFLTASTSYCSSSVALKLVMFASVRDSPSLVEERSERS